MLFLDLRARLKQNRCKQKMATTSKLPPDTVPRIKPTVWLERARDAPVLPIVNCSVVDFVAVIVVGSLLVGSVIGFMVVGLGLKKSRLLDSGPSFMV